MTFPINTCSFVFNPDAEVCLDLQVQNHTPPPDAFLGRFGYASPVKEKIVLMGGCGSPTRDPAMFDNSAITLVSATPDGYRTDSSSHVVRNSLSFDGKFTAYMSWANDLIEEDDDNDIQDVFVYDHDTKTTERMSISSEGKEANNRNLFPTISADGRYVAFISFADNLVPDDNNNRSDVFVYDRQEKTIERVSVSSRGEESNSDSHTASISANGRFVAFNSNATNLVPTGIDGVTAVFVYDRDMKVITRADTSLWGESNGSSGSPTISGDGRFVAFGSWASNLTENIIPGSDNVYNIFLRDMAVGTIKRITFSLNGVVPNGNSSLPFITPDGEYIAFQSKATDLVEGDGGDEHWNVFVYNTETKETTTCTIEANGDVISPSLSDDGKYMAFTSLEYNFDDPDAKKQGNVYVCDIQSGALAMVSRSESGIGEVNGGGSGYGSISGNGAYIAFHTRGEIGNDVFLAKNPLIE